MSGHRRALKRLRDVMAGGGTAAERLDEIVNVVAADMKAEVCSVYIMRAGQVLELFATEGLNPDAVHRTRLRTGEGLVGTVAARARPLNLSEASLHPQFSYRPEPARRPITRCSVSRLFGAAGCAAFSSFRTVRGDNTPMKRSKRSR